MNLPYIPYFTTSRYRVNTMVELAQIQPHDVMADLGSGDGRILIEFARQGIQAHGYELDEKLNEKALAAIQATHLEHLITLHEENFWQQDLSNYSIITVYGMPDIMQALEKKLGEELRPGSRVVSNYYPFPTWKPVQGKDTIHLYET